LGDLLDGASLRPHGAVGKPKEGDMIHIKTRLGSLAVLAAVIGVVAFGTAQAFASSAPTVITYKKTCFATGHCHGDTGDGGTIDMQVTGFAATGKAAQLTLTERITFPSGAWFRAAISGVASPAGFIVLNGTVTASSDGSFLGAQVHQRSNLDGGDGTTTTWTGELRLMPAGA
jgi:hypothetical protein